MIKRIKIYWNYVIKSRVLLILLFMVFLSYFIVESRSVLTIRTDPMETDEVLPEILNGQEYVQSFNCNEDGLSEISLLLATFNRKNFNSTIISLIDDQGTVLQNWKIKPELLKDNTY